MSQIENMAVPTVGNMSKEELLELKKAMNAKALARRRTKTALRVTANVVFAVLILLPLLYAISIALMPSSELFTTELNLFPKNPTFSNFINAWNMYMWPLLVTGSNNMRTVQIGISMLDSVDSQSITLMIAGVVMIIIPSISIFIIGQKQLIRGMFSGAVKG